MKDDKKAIIASAFYTLGNILTKGLTFISIPIFARLLTVSDYGIVNTFTAYVSILVVVIGFASHSCIKNAKIDFGDDLPRFISSLTMITLINTLFLFSLSIALREQINGLLELPSAWLIPLIVVESFAMSLITYYNSVLAIDYKYNEYLTLSLIYAILAIALSLYLIYFPFYNKKWLGRILGVLISALMVAIVILYRIYRQSKPVIIFRYWKYALRISLPIIPHGLSQIVLSQSDRLMINSICGEEKTGLYSFSYNIGTIFQVIYTSIDTAWSQWFFDQMIKKEYNKIKLAGEIYIILMTYLAIVIMVITPELTFFLGGEKYSGSILSTYLVVAAFYFSFAYTLHSPVEYYFKKTKMIAFGTILAALLNVILNVLWIPKFGYMGAACSTLICYVIYYLLHVSIARKVLGFEIYNLKIQLSCAGMLLIVMYLCILFSDLALIRALLFLLASLFLGGYINKNRFIKYKICLFLKERLHV